MKPEVTHEQIEMQLLLPFLKEMLAENKEIKMTVTGSSMFPLLRDRRDSVLLVRPERLQKYDIVLFIRTNGEAVLHRIIKITAKGLIMLGDNQYEKEGPIAPEQVIAVAKGFFRGEQYFSCKTAWYVLYTHLWGRAGVLRRFLRPFVLWCGRRLRPVKRMERVQ